MHEIFAHKISKREKYSNHDLLIEETIAVTALITENHDQRALFPKESLMFCYEAVLRTIDSCLQGKYSDFDAHTTTNCCHGMALFARDLIHSVRQLDLKQLIVDGNIIKQILIFEPNNQYICSWVVSKSLIELTGLYLLALIKETNPLTGGRTSAIKLKNISYISTNLCNKVAHFLKKNYANSVANRYRFLLEHLPEGMNLAGIPLIIWGNYIQPKYLRKDRYGLLYASSLFSMQVCIANLIASKSKVALINDLISSEGELRGRYVSIFQGDGESKLVPLNSDKLNMLKLFHQEDVVVIIGGCVYSDDHDMKSLALQMDSWLHQFPQLVLACEVFYPQFPGVEKDPDFNNTPIVPEEPFLQELFKKLSLIEGVSATDPTLFCSTHIYVSSIRQVLELKTDIKALPVSFIPGRLKKRECGSINNLAIAGE
jgi:hypothetical protein